MKKKTLKIIYIIVIIISIMNICYARYISKIEGRGSAEVKLPILILEKSNLISGEISSLNNSYQTDFNLKNYMESIQRVNEIEFEYTIKLIPSNLNFPVTYTLLDLKNNKEILLDENLESEPIFIGTEKEIHSFRIIANWNLPAGAEKLAENLDVKIKINAMQLERNI